MLLYVFIYLQVDFSCNYRINFCIVFSIAALKSSDKEDTEVIPEDTNLITLKYIELYFQLQF